MSSIISLIYHFRDTDHVVLLRRRRPISRIPPQHTPFPYQMFLLTTSGLLLEIHAQWCNSCAVDHMDLRRHTTLIITCKLRQKCPALLAHVAAAIEHFMMYECPADFDSIARFVSQVPHCSLCGKSGHFPRTCPRNPCALCNSRTTACRRCGDITQRCDFCAAKDHDRWSCRQYITVVRQGWPQPELDAVVGGYHGSLPAQILMVNPIWFNHPGVPCPLASLATDTTVTLSR